MNEAQKNSVTSLKELYTLVVGISLTIAIYNIIDSTHPGFPINGDKLILFISFLITLIPFYHGSLRHLDRTYIEEGGKDLRAGALLVDFMMLFIEACILLVIALLLPLGQFFAWGLLILLAFDVIWGLIAHIGFSRNVKFKAEVKWAIMNFTTVALLVVVFIAYGIYPPNQNTIEHGLAMFILVVMCIRTILDYFICWQYYYYR